MTKKPPSASSLSGRRRVGIVTGFAFGIAVSTIVIFELGAFVLLGILPLLGLAPLVLGPAIGALLAKIGAVPNIRSAPMVLAAFIIASAPVMAGLIEVRQRELPFPIPSGSEVIQWKLHASGERIAIIESAEEVPDFFNRMVKSAIEAGWRCQTCKYQSSTGTGHAHFEVRSVATGIIGGRMGFEVWPGDMALYGTVPSELTMARVYHQQRTQSPGYAVLVLTFLLLATVFRQVSKERAR